MRKADTASLRERLIDWIAGGGTIAAFCRQNPGRSERQCYRWAAEPEFKAAVRGRSAEMTETLVRRLRAISLGSTEELRRLTKDPDPRIRMAAVRTALGCLPSLTTLGELESRIAELEKAHAESQ